MKAIARICSTLLGITFIFSGFVKGIDPLGSQYKFTDYFVAFGWDWLIPAAFTLGVILAFAEFAIGVMLFFGVQVRRISWLALAFMVFFTGLTLHIALTDPVSDCGCFGDAVKLTNWHTFYKNLALVLMAFVVAFNPQYFRRFLSGRSRLIVVLFPVIVYVITVYYSYNHLPIIDFRPYKVGVNIPEGMSIPDDAPQDEYRYFFTYRNKNTGKEEEFTDEDYPWKDTLNWEFVSSKEPKLLSKGYEPPIHDFFIESPEGDDVSDFFLTDDRLTLMLIAYDLEKSDKVDWSKIDELAKYAQENNMNFIGLTASTADMIQNLVERESLPFEFFFCDEIALKTVVRSNPGLVLLKEGTILDKWHHNDIPGVEEFQAKHLTDR